MALINATYLWKHIFENSLVLIRYIEHGIMFWQKRLIITALLRIGGQILVDFISSLFRRDFSIKQHQGFSVGFWYRLAYFVYSRKLRSVYNHDTENIRLTTYYQSPTRAMDFIFSIQNSHVKKPISKSCLGDICTLSFLYQIHGIRCHA